jgi:5-methylcytosine-specific restriction endonuclease McrA
MTLMACIVCGRPCQTGRCPAHKRKRPWYEGDWRKISRARRAAHPLCEICHMRPSVQVDHIIPRSLAGGVRALCAECHKQHGLPFVTENPTR